MSRRSPEPAAGGTLGGPSRPRSSMLNVPESRTSRRSSHASLDQQSKDAAQRTARSSHSRLPPSSSASAATAPVPVTKRSAAQNDVPAAQEKAKSAPAPVQAADLLSNDDLSVSKAGLLERWRARNGTVVVPESELCTDIIYLLQGINGKHFGFEDAVLPASNDFGDNREAQKVVRLKFFGDSNRTISAPTKHLIHRIAELGLLYKRIDDFQREKSQRNDVGLIMQSLCHFLSSELTDYYRLVAVLEAQMKKRENVEDTSPPSSRAPSGLTLRRIWVWTGDVLLRMRMISTIIESCQGAHGGAILSRIHTYTFHGDPLIIKCTAEVLNHVSKPFFHTLSLWIFEGELQDPFGEFFVEDNKNLQATWGPSTEEVNSALYMSTSQDAAPPSSLWQDRFRFRADMLPAFLVESFGRKIFSTGKNLNFIRFGCGDAEWVTARKAMASDALGREAQLQYANLPGLERSIDDAYASSSSRLLDIFLDKFKLLAHLRALKEYMMLTKGDFTDLLMESIGPSLNQPASSLFRHNLTASLETSLRGSNSQYDDVDIVGRLDARILEFKEGDLGWDSFTLEYRVDEPVSTVLDNHAMLGYQIIFHHLWKMKRVELALGGGWERLLLAANMLRRAQPRTIRPRSAMARRAGTAAEPAPEGGDPNLVRTAHQALGHLGEQIHFVKQLQGFVNLEVIEYSWNDLTQLLDSHSAKKRQIDLDELIAGHRAYLNAIIGKVMLRDGGSSSGNKRGHHDHLAQEVKANLDTMLAFVLAIEDLARHITDQLAREDLAGRLGATATSSSAITSTKSLSGIEARLAAEHAKFQASTGAIIGKLEKHSNLVVRDLATRLNFNSYYNTFRESSSKGGGSRRTQAAATGTSGGREHSRLDVPPSERTDAPSPT